MIPPIYNWHACRVCGLPVPAGETAHRECSERMDEPGEMAAHLADAGDVAETWPTVRKCGDAFCWCATGETPRYLRQIRDHRQRLKAHHSHTAAQEARGDE